jgi:hypothetical protein
MVFELVLVLRLVADIVDPWIEKIKLGFEGQERWERRATRSPRL